MNNARGLHQVRNAVVVVITTITLSACQVTLESRLSEEQANEVVVALNSASISANKVSEGGAERNPFYRIEVASRDVSRSLAVLHAERLPKRPQPGWDEFFGKLGVVPTVVEEKARYAAALSGELSRTLEALPGIMDARVHVALPDNRTTTLDATPIRPRASAFVRIRQIPGKTDDVAIKKLIAGAVQEMTPDDVTVVEVQASPASRSIADLVQIGPITITRQTAPVLKVIAGSLLFIVLILAIAVILLVPRVRRFVEKEK
jgi:type III secretion protein J